MLCIVMGSGKINLADDIRNSSGTELEVPTGNTNPARREIRSKSFTVTILDGDKEVPAK